jgi:hypothetical protein
MMGMKAKKIPRRVKKDLKKERKEEKKIDSLGGFIRTQSWF